MEPREIIADDREADLIVVKVEGKAPEGLKLGDSSMIRTGQNVLTVGNPLGLNNSVARGVIAEERQLEGRAMIQVAMPIEPGNSGSPLVDEDGRVIGIIALKSAQSLGFLRTGRWSFANFLDYQRFVPKEPGHRREPTGRRQPRNYQMIAAYN